MVLAADSADSAVGEALLGPLAPEAKTTQLRSRTMC
jgi:hypothetical protein